MNPLFEKTAIIGVGLLGGSLGLALKQRGLSRTVSGAGRRSESLDAALARGAIDTAHLDITEAIDAASLIVVCTPAAQVPAHLDTIRAAGSSAIVTDVASTKARICAHAAATWPRPRQFVGSHPMAGSEKFGVEHADARLYTGCTVIVEQAEELAPRAFDAVCALWRALDANVVAMPPERHDAGVARTSHLPHVMAAAMAALAGRAGNVRPLIGNGFRDSTRIAASRPEIWRDICLTNREALIAALRETESDLARFRQLLEANDGDAIEVFFKNGADARKDLLES